jgi:O-antigen/teichoic acid export membrane protein
MISRPEADKTKTLNGLFSLRLVSALLVIGLAPAIVMLFPYGQDIKDGVLIGAASFVFIALNQVFVGIFQKELRMDKVSIAEVAGRAILLGGIIIAASAGAGVDGFLAAMVAGSAANFFLLYLFSRQFSRINFSWDTALWKEIFSVAWPLSITIILNLIYLRTDILFLSLWKSQAVVGIYGAAYKVIDVVVTIPFIFSGIILPIITSHWNKGEKGEFKSVTQRSFDVLFLLAAPMAAGTIMLSGRIMSLIAGNEFAQSGPALNILIFGAAAIFIGNTAAHAIIAINRQKKIIPAYVFTALTSLVGYAIFIPKYSYLGAAGVTVYSEAMIALFSIWLVYRETGFLPSLSVAAKSACACFVMAAFIFVFRGASLIVLIPGAVAVYFLSAYTFRAISKNDVQTLVGAPR